MKNTTETKMKFTVSQTFETIGSTSPAVFTTLEEAEKVADVLRKGIAEMVSGWQVPICLNEVKKTGYSNEIAAWKEASKLAGVEYDDNGELSDESPLFYGEEAGAYIAKLAVTIETDDMDTDDAENNDTYAEYSRGVYSYVITILDKPAPLGDGEDASGEDICFNLTTLVDQWKNAKREDWGVLGGSDFYIFLADDGTTEVLAYPKTSGPHGYRTIQDVEMPNGSLENYLNDCTGEELTEEYWYRTHMELDELCEGRGLSFSDEQITSGFEWADGSDGQGGSPSPRHQAEKIIDYLEDVVKRYIRLLAEEIIGERELEQDLVEAEIRTRFSNGQTEEEIRVAMSPEVRMTVASLDNSTTSNPDIDLF